MIAAILYLAVCVCVGMSKASMCVSRRCLISIMSRTNLFLFFVGKAKGWTNLAALWGAQPWNKEYFGGINIGTAIIQSLQM